MYRENVLKRISVDSQRTIRFLSDIRRAFLGIGRLPMVRSYDGCECHECETPRVETSTYVDLCLYGFGYIADT